MLSHSVLKRRPALRGGHLVFRHNDAVQMPWVQEIFCRQLHPCGQRDEMHSVSASRIAYPTESQRHAGESKQKPLEWMPWNYRETLVRLATPAAAQYDESWVHPAIPDSRNMRRPACPV